MIFSFDFSRKKAAILAVIVGIAFLLGMAYSTHQNLIPNPGHDSHQVDVVVNGTQKTLQDAIDVGDFGTTIEFAQAFRKDRSGAGDTGTDVDTRRVIYVLRGARSNFIALNNVQADPNSFETATNLDGLKCNDTQGWILMGCWMTEQDETATSNDILSYLNGCVTPLFDSQSRTELSIACIKVS